MKIVAIRDKATEAYQIPFFVQTVGQAFRMFNDEINRPDSPMGAHPEDYDLFEIGDFNEDRGEIQGSNPILRARGIDVKNTA